MNTELKYSDAKAVAHSSIRDIKIHLLYVIFSIILLILILLIILDYSANFFVISADGERKKIEDL